MSCEQPSKPLEIAPLRLEHIDALAAFFSALVAAGDDQTFHPHPFTREEAQARCMYRGCDLYYVMGSARRVLAYGMLRGWDEGFDLPSLGLAVAPDCRRRGFGVVLLGFLHSAAEHRGAKAVRLTVDVANHEARALYARFGYRFVEDGTGRLVGTRSLVP